MGKKIKVTCKLCGAVLGRHSTYNLWSHLLYQHSLRDFVTYTNNWDDNGTCNYCSEVISYNKPWNYDLFKHFQDKHSFKEFFTFDTFTELELLEFHCAHCYKRKTSYFFTCWLDRNSYEKNWVLPVCQWCQNPMSLRRKKDKEEYGL